MLEHGVLLDFAYFLAFCIDSKVNVETESLCMRMLLSMNARNEECKLVLVIAGVEKTDNAAFF